MPAISIITPVYNAEKYIHRCVSSILAQTFADFELILVDDGSTDGSGAVCDAYAAKDGRIKVIHQANQGQAAARNHALDIAAGAYIAFVDSDDYIHPRMLEILWDNARRHGAAVSICGHTKVTDTVLPGTLIPGEARCWEGRDYVRKCFLGELPHKAWLLWDKLFERSCFSSIRMPEGRINEDNAVVYKILYEADRVAECDDTLYYYFQNESSTVNQAFRRKHLDWLLVPQEMIGYFTEQGDAQLVDKANRMYLAALEDMFRKVKTHLQDPELEQELLRKLRSQYLHEKKRYPINIDTHPGLVEILFPRYAWCRWTLRGIRRKFCKR